MRYVVYGAGAVGGVVGGLLHRSGHDVVLIARGTHLAAIQATVSAGIGGRRDGRAGHGRGRPGRGRLAARRRGPAAVKSDATLDAARALAATRRRHRRRLDAERRRERERAAALVRLRVRGLRDGTDSAPRAGLVEAHCHPTPAILDIGRYPDGVDVTAEQVAAAFEKAGIVSVPRPDIMRWKYRKLMMNLGNAVQACCVPDDDRLVLLELIRAEGEAVLSLPASTRSRRRRTASGAATSCRSARCRGALVRVAHVAEPRTAYRVDRVGLPER